MAADEDSLDEPVAAVRRYVEAFNRGDVEAMAACFAPRGSILGGMAPHIWQGETAPRDWYGDLLALGDDAGASDYRVMLGGPLHVQVSDDAAYVVAPASLTCRLDGEPITQAGATFTAALRRLDDGWRIASWAWARGRWIR